MQVQLMAEAIEAGPSNVLLPAEHHKSKRHNAVSKCAMAEITDNFAYSTSSEKVTGYSLISFPKGAEMRQAVRKVRRSDAQETMTAEELFVI